MKHTIVRMSEVAAEPGQPLSAEYWIAKHEQDQLYLRSYPEARDVYAAIESLNEQNRTTNNSQIARESGVSRTRVAEVTRMLRQRGWIKDTSKGAAYHWRTTGKPMPPEATS